MNILMSAIRLITAMAIFLGMLSSSSLLAQAQNISALKTNNTELAYQKQQALVQKQLMQDKLAGYKAGLTSKAGQSKFKVSEPLHGVLFESGRLKFAQAISLSNYQKLMLELELGFVLNSQINKPLVSISELKAKVAAIMPVIELPDLRFKDLSKITGLDLIAQNVAANGFITGAPIEQWQTMDINQLTAKLFADQQLVVEGQGADASGDQWQALLWLINQRVKLGDTIEPGQLLITGALGKMIPAKIAQYKAEFGALGVLEFSIVP